MEDEDIFSFLDFVGRYCFEDFSATARREDVDRDERDE